MGGLEHREVICLYYMLLESEGSSLPHYLVPYYYYYYNFHEFETTITSYVVLTIQLKISKCKNSYTKI
jgi:hypothetical protein